MRGVLQTVELHLAVSGLPWERMCRTDTGAVDVDMQPEVPWLNRACLIPSGNVLLSQFTSGCMSTSTALVSVLQILSQGSPDTARCTAAHTQCAEQDKHAVLKDHTFIECTAISMSPPSRASSISLVKSPLPPMSARGWFKTLSPVVLMTTISRAPSSASSGKAA